MNAGANLSKSVKSNPQAIDWSGLKTAAIALGSVRDAAIRAAGTLISPEDRNRFVERVNKRAYRERWLDESKGKTPSPNVVQTGADVLSTELKERSDKIKSNLAEVAENASEELLKKKGNALLKQHQAFKNFVGGSSQLLAWDTTRPGGSISLNILTGQAAVQINSGSSPEALQ